MLVLASDGRTNLTGRAKLAALEGRFGRRGFDEVCNSHVDLPIWRACRQAILVDPPRALARKVAGEDSGHRVITAGARRTGPRAVLRAMRPYQWPKNLLVALPLLTAHRFQEPQLLIWLLLAFLAFCLVSSGV